MRAPHSQQPSALSSDATLWGHHEAPPVTAPWGIGWDLGAAVSGAVENAIQQPYSNDPRNSVTTQLSTSVPVAESTLIDRLTGLSTVRRNEALADMSNWEKRTLRQEIDKLDPVKMLLHCQWPGRSTKALTSPPGIDTLFRSSLLTNAAYVKASASRHDKQDRKTPSDDQKDWATIVEALEINGFNVSPITNNDDEARGFILQSGNELTCAIAGSDRLKDWVTNAKFFPTEKDRVHQGFDTEAKSILPDFVDKLDSIIATRPKGAKITLTLIGHSLGGAVARLLADYVAKHYSNVDIQVHTFCAPQVSQLTSAESINAKTWEAKVHEVIAVKDWVPGIAGLAGYKSLNNTVTVISCDGSLHHNTGRDEIADFDDTCELEGELCSTEFAGLRIEPFYIVGSHVIQYTMGALFLHSENAIKANFAALRRLA